MPALFLNHPLRFGEAFKLLINRLFEFLRLNRFFFFLTLTSKEFVVLLILSDSAIPVIACSLFQQLLASTYVSTC